MKTKHNYQVPSIKVVSFKVEDGFQSPGPTTTSLNIGINPRTNGIETYDDDSWTSYSFGRPTQTSQN